jgi:hypothetical protein
MDWYAIQMDGDPEAGNVFGREALRLKRDAKLMAWLKAGGRLTDFLTLRQAQGEEKCSSMEASRR